MHCGFVTIRVTGNDGIRWIKRIKIRMADDKVHGTVESDSFDRAFVSVTAIAEMQTRTKRDFLVLDRHEDAKVISCRRCQTCSMPQSTPTQLRQRYKAVISSC